jgi:acetylornithine/succinyldiaminopimelate/putrescine aminotransferase
MLIFSAHICQLPRYCIFYELRTEATEGAMKLAKRITGRTDMVSFKYSYHGSTQGALSVMGDEYWRNSFRPLLPGIVHEDYGHMDSLDSITEKTAMVIAETVQAEKGVNLASRSGFRPYAENVPNRGFTGAR